jgi:hypothetical protein
VIIRFTKGKGPVLMDRTEPWDMRDMANDCLRRHGLAARVRGAEYTKQGQIVITPGADTTVSQLMEVTPVFLEEILRREEGGDRAEVAIESDTKWKWYVLTGIPVAAAILARLQAGTKAEELGATVRREIEEGYPRLQGKLRVVRTLQREASIMMSPWATGMAVLVAVEGDGEEMGRGVGMHLFGKKCRVAAYRARNQGM